MSISHPGANFPKISPLNNYDFFEGDTALWETLYYNVNRTDFVTPANRERPKKVPY